MKAFQILSIIAAVTVPTSLAFSPSIGFTNHRHVTTTTTMMTRTNKLPHHHHQRASTTSTLRMAVGDGNNSNNSNDPTSPSSSYGTTIKTVPDGAVAGSTSFSFEQVQDLLNRIDLTALNWETIRDNTLEGEFGTRGEGYFAVQFLLVFCILLGGVPLVGNTLSLLLGPGLLIAGLTVLVLGTLDLGDSISPWPVPPPTSSKTTGLKTTGIYAQMRHPMYAGLLAAAAGLSIVTGSANRLLLTAIFFYALDVLSKFEEEALVKQFPEYLQYQRDVPEKFFPSTLLKELPWSKAKDDDDQDK